MNKEDKTGLIVCSPEMYAYLKAASNGEMPPDTTFVISSVLKPNVAFTILRDDFIEFLEQKGQGWGMEEDASDEEH